MQAVHGDDGGGGSVETGEVEATAAGLGAGNNEARGKEGGG